MQIDIEREVAALRHMTANRLRELKGRIEDVAAERLDEDQIRAAFTDFDKIWSSLSPREQADVMAMLVASVEFDVAAGTISLSFHNAGIKTLGQAKIGEAA